MFSFKKPLRPDLGDFSRVLEGGRIALRRPRASDAAAITRYVNVWDVAKQTGTLPFPYTTEAAETWLARDPVQWAEDREYTFAIETSAQGGMVGAVGATILRRRRSGWAVGEVGYWLAKPYWGQGLVSEAVGLFADFAHDLAWVERLEAAVFTENEASARVLQKNGFTYKKTENRRYPARGGRRKVAIYALDLV